MPNMPEWLQMSFAALPAAWWIVLGLGLPWALLILPRHDWQDRPMVACLALAFGPALLTLWMFTLGTMGQNHDPHAGDTLNPMHTSISTHMGGTALLRPDLILGGTLVIALIGGALLWWKIRSTAPAPKSTHLPLAPDERVIIGFIALATLARWVISSWLPFGAWDELWVYGYQGRIYTLTGYIPADIGYYPQFIPLQYAFMQIVTVGGISDAAARAVLPFMQVGSILAVYVLGSRLFTQRVGIFAAGLWALYPHFAYWTRIGDLEIPVTFGFTGAAAFFLMAWMRAQAQPSPQQRFLRRRYALIAGLFFGIAMWTKPTAGAFVWGVLLLLALEFIRVRGWQRWLPSFEVAFITGLACMPLGALWYLRNIALGHDALVFPPSFWLSQALRSGGEFGWPLIGLALLLAYLHFGPARPRPDARLTLLGGGLILAGVLPSILAPGRMGWWEWLAFGMGLLVLALHLGIYALAYAPRWPQTAKADAGKIGWAYALALPYFITWFYSYSYHYRLSFAIVPLMLLPTALILAAWFRPQLIPGWRFVKRLPYAGLVVLLCLPGLAIAIYDEGLGWRWLWSIPPEGDYSEAALLGVVATLQAHIEATGQQPVVIAPGLQTLPFFFPEAEIRIVETPQRIEQLAGVDYFVLSREALMAYEADGGALPFQNPWINSLPRRNVVTRVADYHDSAFFYDVYRLHTEERFRPPEMMFTPSVGEVQFGDFGKIAGHNLTTSNLTGGFILELVWLGVEPAPEDYTLFIHLIRADDPNEVLDNWDGPPAPWQFGHYATSFWQAGEYIIDPRVIFPHDPDLPIGDNYLISIGFYNLETGQRAPVNIDGQLAGDSYVLETIFVKLE